MKKGSIKYANFNQTVSPLSRNNCVQRFSCLKIRNKTAGFVCIRPKARKPAKVKAVGMQGVKERACELLLRPCSHSAYTCGLEAGGRPFGKRRFTYSMKW